MDTDLLRVCPYCEGKIPYGPGASRCEACGTKRPHRAVAVDWRGGTPESRAADQDHIDRLLNTDTLPERVTATIVMEGDRRRVAEINGVSAENARTTGQVARDLILVALRKAGVEVE